MSEEHRKKIQSLFEKREHTKEIIDELLSKVNEMLARSSFEECHVLLSDLLRREKELHGYRIALESLNTPDADVCQNQFSLFEIHLKEEISKIKYAIHKMNTTSGQSNETEDDVSRVKDRNRMKQNSDEDSAIEVCEYNKLMVQNDFEDLPVQKISDPLARLSNVVRNVGRQFFSRYRTIVKIVTAFIFALAYFAYFGYAIYVERLQSEGSKRLLWVTSLAVFFIAIRIIKNLCGQAIGSIWQKNISNKWEDWNERGDGKPKQVLYIIGVIFVIIVIACILVAASMSIPTFENLISLVGMLFMVFLCYIGSAYPMQVRWRTVLSGLLLQLVFALFILRLKFGYEAFNFIGNRIKEFMFHANAGAKFLFESPTMTVDNFSFVIFPMIIYFSSMVSVLLHLGIIQAVVQKIALVMEVIMGTTVAESIAAAGNIFLAMTETPLIIRPMIGRMTNSELHAVMTSGIATVSGTVMGAFIGFGVSPTHLVCASVMSAPASLTISKLIYPETKKSLLSIKSGFKMEKSPHKNVIDAAFRGAIDGLKLVASIAAVLISFIGILDFLNDTLVWFGQRVGTKNDLTFQMIASYVMFPFSIAMGVTFKDCRRIGELLGLKIILNEFIAYKYFATYASNRKEFLSLIKSTNITNPDIIEIGNDFFVPQFNHTFSNGFLYSQRSEIIATYSLCGFGGIASMGILLGALSSFAPHRTRDLTDLLITSWIAGNVACFLTACIAGLFFEPSEESLFHQGG